MSQEKDATVADPMSPVSEALSQQTVMLAQESLNEPKPTQNVFELPCGLLDGDNLYKDVVVREISGYEEDMLANQKMPASKKMSELLARCVTRIGPITDKGKIAQAIMDLIVGDRAALIFAIRRVTLGDEYPFKDKCPECEKESLYAVDLGTEISIKEMPDPKKRLFEKVLPSGKVVRFKPMTGHGEEKLAKSKNRDEDALSLAIQMRLETLDGKPAGLGDVKGLGLRDRQALRDAFEEVEGGVDTEVDMKCPHCEHEFKREVDIAQRSFFFPSQTPKNSKAKSST
jgi:hypothetical protein